MNNLPIPPTESIIYQDEKLYICRALYPITNGHTVVVWKNSVNDLHLLPREDYEYLMDIVDATRNSLLEYYKTEKAYLIYMDEVNQVHWHIVPRYNEKGFNVFNHEPKLTEDYIASGDLKDLFIKNYTEMGM